MIQHKERPKYIHTDGSILPSVNQILDATSEAPFKRLTSSQERKKQERMRRGTLCHAAIADLLTRTTPVVDEIIIPWWSSIRSFVGAVYDSGAILHLLEQPLIHPVLRYGGTPDLILGWDKTIALLDLKSTEGTWNYDPDTKTRSYTPYWQEFRKALSNETPPRFLTWDWANPYLKRAFLQTCLYKLMADYHNIPVTEIWIVAITKADFQLIPLPSYLWDDCLIEAMTRLEKFYQQLESEKIA